MCTVTFWPRQGGFRLAMNRDEQWTRPDSRPPSMVAMGGHRLLFPSETGGGTWIGVREDGTAFALVNWYSCPAPPTPPHSSRGHVVPLLLSQCTADGTCDALERLCQTGLRPFRVAGFFPRIALVKEWRWDGHTLVEALHPWSPRQWISSGLNEAESVRIRSGEFDRWCQEPSVGRLEWLRLLHASHKPERGAFSHCVHRADAGTVSYTEITVGRRQSAMFHRAGCPCAGGPGTWHRLRQQATAGHPMA